MSYTAEVALLIDHLTTVQTYVLTCTCGSRAEQPGSPIGTAMMLHQEGWRVKDGKVLCPLCQLPPDEESHATDPESQDPL